jgi:tetratricopeptide (TPR) repeat protein
MSRRGLAVAVVMAAVAIGGCVTGRNSFDRGLALYQEGKYPAAADAFTETITADPSLPAAYVNRGGARVRSGDVGGAIADYTQALRLDPGDPETYFDRGNAYLLVQDYGAAIADYSAAIQASPTFTRAIFNRGTAYLRGGNRMAALADWRTAIELETDPWTKAGMERSAALDSPATLPLATAKTPPAGPGAGPQPPVFLAAPPGRTGVTVMPGTPATGVPGPVLGGVGVPAMPAQDLDARALANRAVSREIDGDRPGAIDDLRAAIVKESDPARRAHLQNLLRLLQTPQ